MVCMKTIIFPDLIHIILFDKKHAADEGIEVGRVTLETRLLARDIERKDWAAAISATRTRMRAIMSEVCVVAHVSFFPDLKSTWFLLGYGGPKNPPGRGAYQDRIEEGGEEKEGGVDVALLLIY